MVNSLSETILTVIKDERYIVLLLFFLQGNYTPSYLVCPETFNWIAIEQSLPKLDLSKYSRLDDSVEGEKYGKMCCLMVSASIELRILEFCSHHDVFLGSHFNVYTVPFSFLYRDPPIQ